MLKVLLVVAADRGRRVGAGQADAASPRRRRRDVTPAGDRPRRRPRLPARPRPAPQAGGRLTCSSRGALGVGVLARRAEEVDADEVEPQRRGTDQRQDRGVAAAPARGRAGVEVGGVDHPGDEGPHLLGVPVPVATTTPGAPRSGRR